ncbi:MAG TPA: hypothetical protein VIH88_00395 [Candidatus Acidoferrales bacterium]
MKRRLLIGLTGVLLVMPSVVAAQHGAVGGFAPSATHVGAVSSGGAPHTANLVRTSSAPSGAVAVASSGVRARAGVHPGDVPSRHAGLSSTQRSQNAGNRVFAPIGPPLGGRRNPPPVGGPRVVYILGVGGYYIGAPVDESGGLPQDAAQESDEVEGQQADGQQAEAPNDRYGDRREQRDVERADNRDNGPTEAIAPAPTREPQEAEQQEPLPDVGTLTLVLRDGTHLDVVAFTMTQGQVVYITPEGRRLTISSDIFDADATQRVNQERGTPMQLPL